MFLYLVNTYGNVFRKKNKNKTISLLILCETKIVLGSFILYTMFNNE